MPLQENHNNNLNNFILYIYIALLKYYIINSLEMPDFKAVNSQTQSAFAEI